MNRTLRVMIIDDEESARKLMRAAIDWQSLGMEVVGEAASGIEAINIIDDLRPDIAFVDISMPFMNGIEFTEVVTGRYPWLQIIIMTAYIEYVKWISFNHLSRSEAYIGVKQSSLVALINSLTVKEEYKNEEFINYIKEDTKDTILRLIEIREVFKDM